jgi:hypothetical protein
LFLQPAQVVEAVAAALLVARVAAAAALPVLVVARAAAEEVLPVLVVVRADAAAVVAVRLQRLPLLASLPTAYSSSSRVVLARWRSI